MALILFMLYNSPLSGLTAVYLSKPHSFDKPYLSSVRTFLPLDRTRCSKFILYFPSQHWVNHPSSGPNSLCWIISFRVQTFGTRNAHCCLCDVLDAPRTKLGHACMCSNLRVNTHLCLVQLTNRWCSHRGRAENCGWYCHHQLPFSLFQVGDQMFHLSEIESIAGSFVYYTSHL